MSMFKHLAYFFLPLPFVAGAVAQEKSIRIGYAQARAMEKPPRNISAKANTVKCYFAHASVGANMIDGLTELRTKDPEAFPLRSFFCQATPPANLEAGMVYEHNRGNPGWKTKMDLFEECVRKDWHAPKVDIVMNKLCYIDQYASAKYYIHSMTNLEASVPGTRVVYMTVPLMTNADSDNFLRNGFNERVRTWTRANNRILFDIADIEAHDRSGKACTFEYRGKTYQKLCDAYTQDGGHLNETGRQLVARGFYALAAALDEQPVTASEVTSSELVK
jgi:hypothetical protein